ncbi:MAG: hypothetical protein JXX29_07525 [Deltaproteobacteria bacterium]|nr:hypothetical protein [Deltaproteobacteria bacterium]MBN2671506.1 hypothetical protein [Deltaproteobacteria bacterium]
MNDLNDPAYRTFVQNIIDNIKKNGFPEKRVAFDLEKMYEAATRKDINFNKVLVTLDDIQIAHEKTPEKVIFYAKDKVEAQPRAQDARDVTSPFSNIDPSLFSNLDPSMFSSMFGQLDMSSLKGMNLTQMMGTVAKMMKQMSPEQMDAIKSMYENMSDEQKQDLMEKAKNFGMFSPDKDKK